MFRIRVSVKFRVKINVRLCQGQDEHDVHCEGQGQLKVKVGSFSIAAGRN